MHVFIALMALASAIGVSITQPEDGGIYGSGWIEIRALVQNGNILPDSVTCSLNGEPAALIPRLNTDWPTYMQNNQNHGYSQSPAPMTSEVLWTAPVCSDWHTFENPVVVEGVVYQVGRSSVYALEAATGQEIWSYPIGGHDDPPSYVDGRLYVQGQDSVYCLDADSGERIWAFHGPNDHGGTPCVLEGRVACAGYQYQSPGHTTVYCLSASDGQLEWSTAISGQIGNCMASWNGMFFVGTLNGPLCALDASTGQTVWSHTITEGGYWDTSPTIVDGKIYIGGMDGAVHRFDAMTGALEWEIQVSASIVEPTPAVFEDMIICGAIAPSDSSVFALRMSDGSKVWAIPGSLHGSPAVADDVVFWGGCVEPYSRVYTADAATGEIIWEFDPSPNPNWGLQCTPSITDGVMYFGSTDGNLYAFGTGLKWTYRDSLHADPGEHELVVNSWSEGSIAASDTVSFTITGSGTGPGPNPVVSLSISPNPFAGTAELTVQADVAGHATLQVFDLSGRLVRTLLSGEIAAGAHNIFWDSRDGTGNLLPSGIYVCRLSTPSGVLTRSLCVLR
jgi:outer membrane protein assembly factor BamB